jgi:hypothetical protein
MVSERDAIDISKSPDVLRLAEEVRRSNTPTDAACPQSGCGNHDARGRHKTIQAQAGQDRYGLPGIS